MRFRRSGIAVVAVVLAAGGGIAAGAPRVSAPVVAVTSVAPGSFSAVVSWTIDRTATVRIAYGTGEDADLAVWTRATSGTSGSIRLPSLEPGVDYRFRVTAVADGRIGETTGGLRTNPAPPSLRARTTSRALVLNGQPVFPRMVYHQCEYAMAGSLAAGINTFMGTACGGARELLRDVRGRGFAIVPIGARGTVDGPGLVGWHQLDEADEHVDTADALPTPPPSTQTGRVTFLTLTNHFYSGAAPLPKGRAIYPKIVQKAEMIGFDLYPLQIWCRKDRFYDVFEAQRELNVLAAGKPTFQWIEAAGMSQCAGLDPSAAIVKAETWLAIAGGARGIGYFPDQWTAPVRAEITRVNHQIRALSAALLAAEGPGARVTRGPVRAGTRELNGALYVIAVNPTLTPALTRIAVPGLGGRELRVLHENRSVKPSAGAFKEYFRGLQVRVYVASPE
ncbi:MAG: hypothetical protein ACKVUT_03640 [Gaiella sp.]